MSRNAKTFLIAFIFIFLDAFILYWIFRIATDIRFSIFMWLGLRATNIRWEIITPLAQMGIIFCIATFFGQGLYPGYGLTAVKELEHIIKSISLSFIFLAAVSYLNKPFQDFSRSVFLLAWVGASISIPVVHFVLRNILSRFSWYGIPVIIFGDSKWADQVYKIVHRLRRLGWQVQAVLPLMAIEQLDPQKTRNQLAILAPSSDDDFEVLVRRLSQRFYKVVLVQQKNNFGSSGVEPHDLEGWLGLEFPYHLLRRRARWLKRSIDVGGSSLLLILALPIFVFLALLIALDSHGPILYKQKRLGQNQRIFDVLKFRTMEVDAEQRLEELLQNDMQVRHEFEAYHKLKTDPRITRVGKWLRRHSLDELPQFWNVLRGDMSLVGPRAYLPSELCSIGPYAAVILHVKPGMTGWWQVFGRHRTTFRNRLKMDEYYISNWSLWMDIYILLKTVWVVLRGQGA